ncbi:MAG TPA: hypothetical protein VHF27_04255 [Acidimicrobiales bacterium]|nr:hypothetical protein [Acidimicrobiales bacterium]
MSGPSRAVLVTGCSNGVRRAVASALAGGGPPVYATARRPDPLAGLEQQGCRTLGEGDDPYRGFTRALAVSTRNVYRRRALARLAGTPDDVAQVVLEAVTSPKARARYPVTPSARRLRGLRALLPDRGSDALLARSFVRPGGRRG